MKATLKLVEQGVVPKPLLRHGIRRLLKDRLREQEALYAGDAEAGLRAWVDGMRSAPIAPVPEKANEQHYELPPEFFRLVLGPRLKYSSALYVEDRFTLAEAEEAMLATCCERARLANGQRVLELGCGWGSMTLWMAEQYPESSILGVSNSALQREHILSEARRRDLGNVDVVTCDMNDFDTDGGFDRVVSIEMFEHMRNWEKLLERVAGWLKPDGLVFLHYFAHRDYAYPFEVKDDSDWMSRYFFTGGMMPCSDLVRRVDSPFETAESWIVPGQHYARTSEDWVANLERNKRAVLDVFRACYGPADARTWYHRWRVFFLACAELFGYGRGSEWVVAHHLLRPRSREELPA
jgi:cyclopropane-fatty-acyl-phospholipid synthase